MFFYICIFHFIIFIFFSKLFFRSKESFTYNKMVKTYIIFFIILVLISIRLNFLNFNQPFNFLCIVMNFMIFISYILTIGIKFVIGPSYYIIDYLEKNPNCKKEELLHYLEKTNMIEERIQILKKERLLLLEKDNLIISKNGKIFCRFFLVIKKFLGIKCEG